MLDHLVERVHHWPGVNGFSAPLNGRTIRARRPLHFFRPDGGMPDELEMSPTIPAELGPAVEVLWELRDRVRRHEQERAAERLVGGAVSEGCVIKDKPTKLLPLAYVLESFAANVIVCGKMRLQMWLHIYTAMGWAGGRCRDRRMIE